MLSNTKSEMEEKEEKLEHLTPPIGIKEEYYGEGIEIILSKIKKLKFLNPEKEMTIQIHEPYEIDMARN